jgi:hypothetical protein
VELGDFGDGLLILVCFFSFESCWSRFSSGRKGGGKKPEDEEGIETDDAADSGRHFLSSFLGSFFLFVSLFLFLGECRGDL